MWSKLYIALLGLSIVVLAFFTYYSWSWLQSIGLPAEAIASYQYHSRLSWTALWLSAAALLILGNVVLWTAGRTWAMWTTFLYFSAFIVVRYFWLDEKFLHFMKSNGLFDGSFSVGPFFAVILIAIAAAIVFFDQFIVTRLRAKTFPVSVSPEVTKNDEQPAE